MDFIAIGTVSDTHDFIIDNKKTTDMQSKCSIASHNSNDKQESDANSNYSDSDLSSADEDDDSKICDIDNGYNKKEYKSPNSSIYGKDCFVSEI